MAIPLPQFSPNVEFTGPEVTFVGNSAEADDQLAIFRPVKPRSNLSARLSYDMDVADVSHSKAGDLWKPAKERSS